MADNLQVDDQLPLDLTKDQKPAPVIADGDDPIAELKKQLADRDAKAKAAMETAEAERRGRMEAEQREQSRSQEVEQYRSQAQTAEQRAVTNYLDAANRESESAQRELETALNAGDYANVAKIQAKIAKTAAQIVQLETAKTAIDAQVRQPQQVRVDATSRQVDPTEQFISAQNPRVQALLRQHPEMVVSKSGRPDFSNAAWAAHHSALAQGIAEGSEDYFAHLAESVAPRQRQQADEQDELPAQRRAAQVAAPVSRDTPNNTGRSATRIRLSPEQVEIARISGITEAQYAENLQALKSEGKIGRTTH
jgi:hypothetical protein